MSGPSTSQPSAVRPSGGGASPVFDERFEGDRLDPSRWLEMYLPHWSEPQRTRPSHAIEDGVLRLTIAPDQPEWCPEFDPGVRVSSVQTGHFAGSVGSDRGQHRFRDGLVVRSHVEPRTLFAHHRGRLEMRARAWMNPNNLVSLWMIGLEDEPHRSGEITLMEVFGNAADEEGAVVGRGIKRVRDPRLRDEFHETRLPIRIGDWHDYAYEWTPEGVRFFVDGEQVSACEQSPDYPMQIMLNLYELPDRDGGGKAPVFEVAHIRAWETQ